MSTLLSGSDFKMVGSFGCELCSKEKKDCLKLYGMVVCLACAKENKLGPFGPLKTKA